MRTLILGALLNVALSGLAQLPSTLRLSAALPEARAVQDKVFELTVSLWDVRQKLAPADREYPVTLSALAETTGNELLPQDRDQPSLTFMPGEHEKTVKLALSEPGFVQLSAASPLLLTGGLVLYVSSTDATLPAEELTGAVNEAEMTADAEAVEESALAVETFPHWNFGPVASPSVDPAERSGLPSGGIVELPGDLYFDPVVPSPASAPAPAMTSGAAAPPFPFSGPPPMLVDPFEPLAAELDTSEVILSLGEAVSPLDYQVLLKLPGDSEYVAGVNQAEVGVFLTDAAGDVVVATEDVWIQLEAFSGELQPSKVLIPAGALSATTQLSSDQAGTAEVSVSDGGGEPVLVTFLEQRISIEPSQPIITLVEPLEITIRLTRRPDEPGTVSLSLKRGAGRFNPSRLEFGEMVEMNSSRFFPSWLGLVHIKAVGSSAINAAEAYSEDIEVSWMMTLGVLSLTALGGIVGAGASIWRQGRRRSRLRVIYRVLLGIVSGTVLSLGVAVGLLPYLPPDVVATLPNLVSLTVLAVLGGYAGELVFNRPLKDLSLNKPTKTPQGA